MFASINAFKIYNFIHDEIPFFLKSYSCNTDICEKDGKFNLILLALEDITFISFYVI